MRQGSALRATAVSALLLTALCAGSASEAEEQAECRDDAILVFDASGLMASTDPSGVSRIHRVREATARVVPQIAPVRNLGLMVYGGGATNGCSNIALKVEPGPNNAGPIIDALRGVLPNGRTPLTESIRQAAEKLSYRTRPATIVLLTDGEESCGGDPCALAARLHKEGPRMRIHVIDYKQRFGSDWRGTLQSRCLAETTGGRHIAVNTVSDLIAALRDTLGCPYVTQRNLHMAGTIVATPAPAHFPGAVALGPAY